MGLFKEPPTGLIPWFSKTEGNTYATIDASPSPLQGKPTQDQDVASRIFGAVAREVRASQDLTPDNEPFLAPLPGSLRKSQHTKYPSQSLSLALHYLPFASFFLSPTSPLPFHLPSLSQSLPLFSCFLFPCPFVCSCVGLLVCRDGSRCY